MIRITFDLLPGGNVDAARTIGIMELANLQTHADGTADYAVAMKKTPPFSGALRDAWKKGRVKAVDDATLNAALAGDDEELIVALVTGHHRTRRGVYDLLYRAMLACGLGVRNP